ncbi:MAG TPA: GAF domain-containing sensor histidine kinase [Solirubrobacteraceae bacterium]|jgi:signal transduction histidine kinase|nr:GAF domain-containing sensor histidine kinase [Solirubrobacteraceae bacterium]
MSDNDQTLPRLIEIGRALVTELDPETVLHQILHEAREITGASYAALGVVSEDRHTLERFLTSGIDEQTQRAIGSLPRGRGVLGTLITDPRPLRLDNVSEHQQSYGLPANHPPMKTFLGVPIVIRGESWGNLYLCEKAGGESFTQADEDAAMFLAQWAATAIENARLYDNSEHRRVEAEHAVLALQAAQDIADAIGSVADLSHVLELIVKRGRALVEARSVLILLREAGDLVVAASAGQIVGELGRRIPISGSTTGQVLLRGQPERIADVSTHVGLAASEMGVPDAHSALIVPMFHRSVGIGVLAAFDRGVDGGESFQLADEQLLRTFAASAANAVAVKRSVEADRLHAQITAAEAERRRWARELHDQTLQSLGAVRVLLSSAARRGDPEEHERAIRQAIEDLELETNNLRAIITDLRPSLLDDLGLVPALDSLVDRHRESGLAIEREIELPASTEGGPELEPELATTIYRLIQESLTNVVKHSRAKRCRVVVNVTGHEVFVEVTDDGGGYDTSLRAPGFGLPGMRERVYLAGGRLELESGNGGTVVRAYLPVDGSNVVRPGQRVRADG